MPFYFLVFPDHQFKTLNNEELADGPGGDYNCVHVSYNCAIIYSVDPRIHVIILLSL